MIVFKYKELKISGAWFSYNSVLHAQPCEVNYFAAPSGTRRAISRSMTFSQGKVCNLLL